eukprot:gene37724-18923_t
MHMDQWDNLICQMQGTREVTLYDPFHHRVVLSSAPLCVVGGVAHETARAATE